MVHHKAIVPDCHKGRPDHLLALKTVLPYPWPKGRFRLTTLTLVHRLQSAFPLGVGWSLVADRGFRVRPSSPTCATAGARSAYGCA